MLGMSIQVEGSPYAEIEDLVLNEEGQVTSAVIDPDGMETVNYWIPTEIGWVNPDWVMVLPYSQIDIEKTDSYRSNSSSGNGGSP